MGTIIKDGVYVYDIETYKNVFTLTLIEPDDTVVQFEISDRRNELFEMCSYLDSVDKYMVGYNNLKFDYPVLHWVMQTRAKEPDARTIWDWAQHAIKEGLRTDGIIMRQLDLMKIWHYDNKARMTSLKLLEFNMRMDNIEDLPFHYESELTFDQIDTLLEYNLHDCRATKLFFDKTVKKISFRESLGEKYLNYNDTKIGKSYFIDELQNAGIKCYAGGKPRQTKREQIALKDAILPEIEFEHPAFKSVLSTLKSMVITETRGAVDEISADIDGFKFDFGLGGIHGSINSEIVTADDEYIIEDWDVASYYPNLGISNGFYPEHLSSDFCRIYSNLYEDRKKHPKSTHPEINAMLKLALNGVFGDSNSEFSPFYDPLLTMKITLNGQLLLCLLAETLLACDDIRMLQVNTDGLTIKYPRKLQEWVHGVCKWWEDHTRLELESAEYDLMAIRDVNHYIARYTDGKVKRKGAYEYELDWHQNHSMLVVKKAVEKCILEGVPVEDYIRNHDDPYDFFLRIKPDRKTTLEHGEEQFKGVTRYYVSTDGKPFYKIMPSLGPIGQYTKARTASWHDYNLWHERNGNEYNEDLHTKSKKLYDVRKSAINSGYKVSLSNRVDAVQNIDYDFYINEANKLRKVFT